MFLKNRGQQLGQETNRMAGQERGREDDKRGGGVVISPYTWEQQHGQDQPSQETDGECWRRASHSSMWNSLQGEAMQDKSLDYEW